jgi:5-methyltetrahydrofolate--homocysteine methyltransferase
MLKRTRSDSTARKFMANSLVDDLANAVAGLDIQIVVEKTMSMLKLGLPPKNILHSLNMGMQRVGEKYEAGEYFVTELVFAGEIMRQAVEIVGPHLATLMDVPKETIVVGTVKGDLHDLGKNLFIMFARAAGFNIIDLGVDVAPQTFKEQVKETATKIVGMSALMSTTQPSMRDVIEMLKKDGTRDKVKVILGGAGITERFGTEIGADAAVNDAMKGSRICSNWVLRPDSD